MSTPHVLPRGAAHLESCVEALAAVHMSDGYPVRWPTDPVGWLTPPGLLAAFVAVAGSGPTAARQVVGHMALSGAAGVEPCLIAATGLPPTRVCAVARLFVTPPARRQGVAAALLETAARYAADRGLRLVLDVVHDGVAAIALYERSGWRRVASSRTDWLASDGRPAVVHHYISPEPDSLPAV